jgi:tRNA U34 2-thiouridine synthase MnmA/TrmU
VGGPEPGTGTVVLEEPTRRVAPGQAVVLYAPGSGDDGGDDEGEVVRGSEVVLGGGTAA